MTVPKDLDLLFSSFALFLLLFLLIFFLFPIHHSFNLLVKALLGLGMLDMSVALWVQGFSEFKWIDGSDEGTSPN